MSAEHPSPIFIHSLWRAGSTYLFQVFRRSEVGYYCYQEPLHELVLFNKNNPQKLFEYSGDLMRPLRHPELSRPYYQELYDTHHFWKDQITKSDIYDAYFSSECSETFCSFFKALIEHAQGRTVIQECRTSNRIGALKKCFGGSHVYLWRNPWDQWWSYKATDYFDMIQLLLINAVDVPPVIRALQQALRFKEYHNESLQEELSFFNASRLPSENSYRCFYMLWCLAFLEAQQHADFLLNIDQLSVSPDYQTEFLETLSKAEITGLDFSDCRIHCTQFTTQDAAFFKPLEDMVYELLLQHVGPGQVDAIKEAREKYMPESQSVLSENTSDNPVLEDARRTREVVIRLETAFNSRMQEQLVLQENLQQKFNQQLDQQKEIAEQQRSDLQRQYDERENQLALQYAGERQAFEKLSRQRAEQLLTAEQQHAAREKELLQEQLAVQIRIVEREREFSEQLKALHRLADQEKKELSQQFAAKLIAAAQEHSVREKELLQEQLTFQIRSAEQETSLRDQLQILHKAAAVLEAELRQQLLLEHKQVRQLSLAVQQTTAELSAIHTSFSWWLTAPLRFVAALCRPSKTATKLFNQPLETDCVADDTITEIPSVKSPQINTSEKSENMTASALQDSMQMSKTVNELLSFHGEQFVRAAYITLLGREPDEEGIRYYGERLRQGFSKETVLLQLAQSKEARSQNVTLKGLDELLRKTKKANHWFWGMFGRKIQLERNLHRIEFEIEGTWKQFGEFEARLTNQIYAVEQKIDHLLKTVMTISNGQEAISEQSLMKQNVQNTSNASDLSHMGERAYQLYRLITKT